MSRAERRRMEKKKMKVKTATYNFTEEQLKTLIEKHVGEAIRKSKEEATNDAVNTAMTLLLVLPMEVLMDHYWQKSYAKRIPEFTNYVLEYYEKWQNGELNMDEMKADLWEYGGVRLEETGGC